MTTTLVRDIEVSNYSYIYQANRFVHRLSDGSWIMVVRGNDGIVRVMHSPNKTTWTQRGASAALTFSDQKQYASCIDASNNVYVAWKSGSQSVSYLRFAYTAGTPTFTPGSTETAITGSGGEIFDQIAIEALDSGAVVVGVLMEDFSPYRVEMRLRVRHSGGSWGTANDTVTVATELNASPQGLSIARDDAGASGGTQRVAVSYCGGNSANWELAIWSVTITTGAIAEVSRIASIPGDPNGYSSAVQLFSTGANQWTAGGMKSYTTGIAFRFSHPASGTSITPSTSALVSPFDSPLAGGTEKDAYVGWNYVNDRIVFIYSRVGANAPLGFDAIHFQSGIAVVEPGTHNLAGELTTSGNVSVYGGNNRNFATDQYLFALNDRSNTGDMYAWFVSAPTHAVSGIVPVSGATVTSDTPTLQGNPFLNASTSYKVAWQLATDSGFSSNLRTVLEDSADYSSTSILHSEVIPDASKLSQTLWYIRAAAIDIFGQVGTYGASHSFTVSHPPSQTNLVPVSTSLDWGASGQVTFDWDFTDPSPTDSQTAFQIVLEVQSTGAVVWDTGKVVSTATQYVGTIDAAYKDIQLRWRLRVWDTGDIVGSYSAYHLFFIRDKPTVSITAPAEAGTVDSPRPTITWSFSAGGGRTQSQRRVLIVNSTTGVTVHDTGFVVTSDVSYTPPSPVLVYSQPYTVTVTVQDSSGLQNSDTNAFTASWTPPAVPTTPAASITSYDASGYVTISWNATVRDTDFYSWRIYRRETGATGTEVLISEDTNVLTASYQDWMARSGVSYEYAVVQVANKFGVLLESDRSWLGAVTPIGTHYWLIHPTDTTKNYLLYQVIEESFAEEYEQETYTLIGRGRKTDFGDRLGYAGTLSAQLRERTEYTARSQRLDLEELKAEQREMYLRNPFGDLWLVTIGNLAISRLSGVGRYEYVDISISYTEVS